MELAEAYLELSRIPHLWILQSELRKKLNLEDAEININEGYLEQLPHALASAAYALVNVYRMECIAISSVRQRAPSERASGTRVCQLEFNERYPIVFAVDHFLDAAVRTQNAVTWYLSKALSIGSLPSSLRDIVTNAKRLQRMPTNIRDTIETYWASSGERLRNYRDLSQHYAVVTTEGRVYLLPSGHAQIHVILPTNPEVKSIRDLVYGTPDIDAYAYVCSAYRQLYAFTFAVTDHLLATLPPSEEHTCVFAFKGGMTFDFRHMGVLRQSEESEIRILLDFVRGFSRRE